MKIPASSSHDSDKERAYQEHLAALTDQLLLNLRDGAWAKVTDVALWLAPRLKPEFSVFRFLESGGTYDQKLPHQAGEGQKLVLKDILDSLRKKKLLAGRTNDGEDEIQVTPLTDDRFDIDPEFENLLPRAPDEVKKLEERLLVEDPRDPLVVWKGHRKLVDGHTRFRFYSLLGKKYDVVEMDFPDRNAVISWLYDTHYGRRSYSPEMKSYVRGQQYLARKKQHGGARKKASGHSGNLKTADLVAAEYGIDRRTVLRDGDFAEALDKVAGACGDEVRQKVLSRVVRWSRGDVARLTKLDKGEMEGIVRKALESGGRPKFPASAKKAAGKSITLPMDKPVAQARALRKLLGARGLLKLHKALTRMVEKRKGSQSPD